MVSILAVLGLLIAVPSSATIVFVAVAGLDMYGAPCAPGVEHFKGYHSGEVYSMDPGDSGRTFTVDGQSGRCGFSGGNLVVLATCSTGGTAGTTNLVACCTDFEQSCNPFRTYRAETQVYVDDSGGESASDATSCASPGCS
jgi:hypothetical protein